MLMPMFRPRGGHESKESVGEQAKRLAPRVADYEVKLGGIALPSLQSDVSPLDTAEVMEIIDNTPESEDEPMC